MSGPIFIDQLSTSPDEVRLAVRGCLQGKGTDALLQRVGTLLDGDARLVTIDVGGVTALDNEGLGALVKLRRYARAAGVEYRVAHAPPLLDHLLAAAEEAPV
jgi:anti-anti-sigma regulatory factor